MKIKDYEIKALKEMLEKDIEDNPRIARSFLEDVVSDLEELQALKEKATPKKPKKHPTDNRCRRCPCCGLYYGTLDSYKYCPNCGQKFD